MSSALGPAPKQIAHWITLGFVGFLAAYVVVATALRGQFDLRYDDTVVVHSHLLGSAEDPENIDRIANELGSVEYWQKLWLPGYHGAGVAEHFRPHAYRPLQSLYNSVATLLYFRVGAWLPYLVCFLLLGLSGYLSFRLFQEVGSVYLAAICAAAYLFFPAVVSPAWNPLAGPQSIIPGLRGRPPGIFALSPNRPLAVSLGDRSRVRGGALVQGNDRGRCDPAIGHQLFVAPVKRWGLVAGLALACVHGIFPKPQSGSY